MTVRRGSGPVVDDVTVHPIEPRRHLMNARTRIALAVAAALAVVGVGTGIAVASSADDEDDGPDVPIEGADLDRASAAALEHTGEGRVTDTEVGDEESYYEVEVTLDDGTQVDVQLDEQFRVVGESADEEGDDED
jgi:hypothetical protein